MTEAKDFTHFNQDGRARMVDVGRKEPSCRRAVAAGRVLVKRETLDLIRSGGMKKGDVLTVAQVAGVMGAKRTADWIPMCHPVTIDGIDLALHLDETRNSIEIQATVSCVGRTGVEMEALTAVTTAALTVYDMCKAVQKDMVICDIRLLEKTGGVHGIYQRKEDELSMEYTAAVITISDKGAAGDRVDTSGPALCAILQQDGWDVVYTAIVPDQMEAIQAELIACADQKNIALLLTTGGTGFSPRDITPEATLAVIQRQAPGIPETMRAESMRITPKGCLSRGVAGIRNRTLIVNLPGSEKAARENLAPVLPGLKHGVDMLYSEGSADCASAETARRDI